MMESLSFLVCAVAAFWLFRKFWSLRKRHELHPAGHAMHPAPLMEAPNQRQEFMSRLWLEQLGEDFAMVPSVALRTWSGASRTIPRLLIVSK